MAERDSKSDEKIMAMVEAELKRNPRISVDDLLEKAKAISSAVARLSKRQFHARYPLQVKRRRKALSGSRRATGRQPAKKTAAPSAGRKRRARRKTSAEPAPEAPAPASTASTVDRDAIRAAFFSFASDLAAAEARKDVVKVVAGVDKYVNQVVKSVG